jgi:hypothetical protein
MDELEDARARRSVERRRRARNVRLIWGFILSLVAAGGLGLALGLESHATPEELAAPAQGPRGPLDREISEQVNRTLLELWRMEDVEAGRARRIR